MDLNNVTLEVVFLLCNELLRTAECTLVLPTRSWHCEGVASHPLCASATSAGEKLQALPPFHGRRLLSPALA